jgi:hypothetical protein
VDGRRRKKKKERTGMKTDALWPESPYKGYNNESIEGPGRPSGEFRLSKVCPFFLPQLPPLVPVGERLLSHKKFFWGGSNQHWRKEKNR